MWLDIYLHLINSFSHLINIPNDKVDLSIVNYDQFFGANRKAISVHLELFLS